ncbi:MAG: glycosyltransferase family 2 protein [Pseudomonadota bacterium]|nr:glycosyltransferase family 2 protein [Pseudomonadota bacterium]
MTPGVPVYTVAREHPAAARYCVVIPVINEGRRIQLQLERMAALGLPQLVDVIIVDGGSTDGSLAEPLLENCGVNTLLVKTGPGKLSAQLRCGYHFALERGYAGVITIDGNNKDDPDTLPQFVAALDAGYDFVQASRFVPGGVAENTPLLRWAAIRLVHAPLLSLASGFHWTDTTQGYRAYSRALLSDPRVAIFRDLFSSYELLAYLSYRAPRLGYRCIELPTARRYPRGEKAPTKISPIAGNLKLIATLLKACTGQFNPGSD